MSKLFSKLLTVRGVHFCLTRFGPPSLRRLSFNQKYIDGEWNFSEGASSILTSAIEEWANGGDILMLGCGTAGITQALKTESFTSFLGIDLSEAAITAASRFANNKVEFRLANMVTFCPPKNYSVILMSESLYYVTPLKRRSFLRRLSQQLKPGGAIIVTISESERFHNLLTMIRRNFFVHRDEKIGPATRHMIIFS